MIQSSVNPEAARLDRAAHVNCTIRSDFLGVPCTVLGVIHSPPPFIFSQHVSQIDANNSQVIQLAWSEAWQRKHLTPAETTFNAKSRPFKSASTRAVDVSCSHDFVSRRFYGNFNVSAAFDIHLVVSFLSDSFERNCCVVHLAC